MRRTGGEGSGLWPGSSPVVRRSRARWRGYFLHHTDAALLRLRHLLACFHSGFYSRFCCVFHHSRRHIYRLYGNGCDFSCYRCHFGGGFQDRFNNRDWRDKCCHTLNGLSCRFSCCRCRLCCGGHFYRGRCSGGAVRRGRLCKRKSFAVSFFAKFCTCAPTFSLLSQYMETLLLAREMST